jgi:hypothetical protein
MWWKIYYPINKPEEQCIPIIAGIEQHKQGLPAKDPLTGKLVGPLSLSRLALNDPKRKSLLALAHFPLEDVKQYKENGRDASFLVHRFRTRFYVVSTLCIVTIVITAVNFNLLNSLKWGWLPIIAFILAGALVIFLYVVRQIQLQITVLQSEAQPTDKILDMYIQKWEVPDDDK